MLRRPSLALLTRSRTAEPLNGATTGDKTTLMTPEKPSKKDSSKTKTKKGLMRSVSRLFSSAAAPANQPPLPRAPAASLTAGEDGDEDEDAIRRPSGLGPASLRSLPSPTAAHERERPGGASCSRGGQTSLRVMLLQRLACAPNARPPSPRPRCSSSSASPVVLRGKFGVDIHVHVIRTGEGAFEFDYNTFVIRT
ncbi:hypothetical protein C8J57DRAFT_1566734 [Mycena rebaudengoi]|nr:hypothetical protein C8J57DRAFT_1566734 [Mycena rebaudengoi]